MATVNYVQARKICTPEELRVVEATRRETLTQLGIADLKKHITLARRLRNKWRDLSTRQRRRTQAAQNARVTEENRRSQQKAELFEEVLGRLEKQLAQLAAAPQDAPAKQSPADKPPKQVRAAEHRSQRAEVRKKLEEKRTRMTKAKRPAARGTSVSADAAPDAAASDQPAAQAAEKPDRTPATKAAKAGKKPAKKAEKKAGKKPAKKASGGAKKQPARKKPAGTPSASKSLGRKASPAQAQPNLGAAASKGTQQVRVKAEAKKARVQASGLTTRTRGHVSARGKRSQSRRDSRN
jgi:hypothetical protein